MADDVDSGTHRSEDSSVKMENEPAMETSLLDLPPEIIRTVLTKPSMSLRDVSRLAQTCQSMNALVSDDCNDVWRSHHRRRWLEAHRALMPFPADTDWLTECKFGFHLECRTVHLMNETWPKVYMESEVCYSQYIPLRKLMEEHEISYFYIKDFLLNLIKDDSISANLTRKYHARSVLTYVSQEYLTRQWNAFKALPDEEKMLEVGVGYVSQWSLSLSDKPNDYLGNQLDEIATSVLQHLSENHPSHPIFSIEDDDRLMWGKKNLARDMWNAAQCLQIFEAMDHVLIKSLGLHGTKEYYHHRENYLIHLALEIKTGVPITLNAIVECIARRLGVRTELWYRGHFVMKWQSDDNPDLPELYLDAFNSGGLIRPASYMGNSGSGCPYRELSSPKGPTSVMEVIERLTAGIEVAGRISMRNHGNSTHLRSALELMFVINPKNLTYILHLARLYMLHNISVSDLIESITSSIDELPSETRKHAENILQMFKVYSPEDKTKPPPAPWRRYMGPQVTYAVGMSMLHKRFNYLCVISGWDPICSATDIWKHEMGVQWLTYKDNQPFYNVLVPDGTTRYAAQENLEPVFGNDPLNVFNTHPDVGRYFESYQNGYYLPNSMKQAEYPDDLLVCQHYYSEYSK